MINYDPSRNIEVTHERYSSTLVLNNVERSDTANYSCLPSNASPASIFVHIINGTSVTFTLTSFLWRLKGSSGAGLHNVLYYYTVFRYRSKGILNHGEMEEHDFYTTPVVSILPSLYYKYLGLPVCCIWIKLWSLNVSILVEWAVRRLSKVNYVVSLLNSNSMHFTRKIMQMWELRLGY
jgi:hypothetical protein